MKHISLILLPLAGALISVLWPGNRSRPWIMVATSAVHTILCLWMLIDPPVVQVQQYLGFDPVARAILPCVSLLFLLVSFYGVSYLNLHPDRPNRVFVGPMLCILGLLSAGHQARHLGVLWIATEGVTLAAIPLLHFAKTARAYEATWKYLLVGGAGIALSLLGSFCMGYASLHSGGHGDLFFASLIQDGPTLTRPWLLTSWVLLLAGYGTKMGLAPMHTWKPDTYGEAPGIVGAVLAGGVTTVAFTALLRVRAVVVASGAGGAADLSLMAIGLFSMLVAALFLLGTRDYKRMLAYSSVEHMGILSFAVSLGPIGMWASLFHVWSNALTKGTLFLSASTIRRNAGTRTVDDTAGMALMAPRSSILFVTGLFAITACPPFAPFFSEITVLRSALEYGHPWAAAGFLGCLFLAFLGMSRVVFAIIDARPKRSALKTARRKPEGIGVLLPPLILILMSLWLGLFTPEILQTAWTDAVSHLNPTLSKP